MGRKPNLLIQEFFQRGAKLDDQSNRYEHTCKKCGMFFPKGRPDSMNRHLFEKCPNITDYDKSRAFAFAQGQMDVQKIAQRLGQTTVQPLRQPAQNVPRPYPTTSQPPAQAPASSLNREPSALDTLAEVSRQHLDLSRQRNQGDVAAPTQEQNQQDNSQEMDSWMIQLQQQLNEANNATAEPSDQVANRPDEQGNHSGLVHAASAASRLQASLDEHTTDGIHGSEHLEGVHEGAEYADGNNDSGFDHAHNGFHDDTSANLDPALQMQASSQPAPTAAMTNHSHLPHAPFEYPSNDAMHTTDMRGFGLLSRPLKRQRRNKFSTERRKEVGGIRKLGACLRCRMLKKPCSGETPCSTCKVIGNPRLWHMTCIRTRVADEFSLYNTSYLFAQARSAVASEIGGMPLDRLSGRIDISVTQSDSKLSFPSLGVRSAKADARANDFETLSLVLHVDTEESIKSVDRYLANALPSFVSLEPRPLIRVTINTLQSLSSDLLITRALHLWAATTIICASSSLPWTILYTTPNPDKRTETPHLLSTSRSDYPVLQAQLLDAVERFAAATFKLVANELERRLLARGSSNTLTTYLVTILLLNCVERMSLLFRRFDPRVETDDGDVQTIHAKSDWPLNQSPAKYVAQAGGFCTLLGMLLRMRNLVPRTVARGDDTLVVVKIQGRRVVEITPEGESDDVVFLGHGMVQNEEISEAEKEKERFMRGVAGWLRETGVGGREIWERTRIGDDDIDGDWMAWDLRFVGALVVPDGYEDVVQGGQDQAHVDSSLGQTGATANANH
ncbi:hypothetical protein B9Z65_2859 [Elsinoe australis]|uniref:Uncharacterized protein n=1 Tax=Elsinoe australis TaxID=40998 RepID=A0A2P8A4S1_9PEZI|nr:hypothetical protein B9Z65_2859 [Elsinoe australis]